MPLRRSLSRFLTQCSCFLAGPWCLTMVLSCVALVSCIAPVSCVATVLAEPHVPANDAIVLERLPRGDARDNEARSMAVALARNPTDLDLALRLARVNIARGQTLSDPRVLGRAEAVLAPWIALSNPPTPVRLLRGILRQSNHDFDGSLTDLGHVIDAGPANAPDVIQARLTRAVVHQVRADYEAARQDCVTAAPLLPRSAALACVAGVASLTGRARLAMSVLTQAGADPAGDAASRVWALTLLGEIAARLDDVPAAERAFAQARSLAPDDTYLLSVHADLLLDSGRAEEVIPLLAGRGRVDPLLLRLAEAQRRLGRPNAGDEARLADRLETSRRRGETVHQREEARFTLHILGDATEGLRLAEANWRVQREPADARILLEAALAAHAPDRAAPVLSWLERNGVEDVRLAGLASRLRSARP